jgi:cell division protein FtsZ
VVTKPFSFEGKRRSRQAEEGIRTLEESVDSLICIPNQRLLQLAGENLSLVDTFKAADEVLLNAVQGISDLINNTGLINADFADVATVMTNKGLSLMGTGIASGTDRATKAAKQAISSPLLEDVTIDGATGIIINISGNGSLTTHETNQAVTLIMEAADEDAEIIFGTVIDDSLGDDLKVTVIATGLRTARKEAQAPVAAPVMRTEEVVAPRPVAPAAPVATAAPVAPVQAAKEVAEVRTEVKTAPRVEMPTEDYAVKEEITFDYGTTEDKPKINWAEKLQTAANKYDSQKTNMDTRSEREFTSPYDNHNSESKAEAHNASRESRIKSIAEKLGFFNFDEDEFDTPSFMKKNDRNPDQQI